MCRRTSNNTSIKTLTIPDGKYYESDSTNPRESNRRFFWPLHYVSMQVYNVNNCRFTEFFDRYFHIPLQIITKHELSLPFPPRNLPIKFGTNPFTIYLVIVVTDRHTDGHTNQHRWKHSLAFVGIITRCYKSIYMYQYAVPYPINSP